jgi:hypothetical protein
VHYSRRSTVTLHTRRHRPRNFGHPLPRQAMEGAIKIFCEVAPL